MKINIDNRLKDALWNLRQRIPGLEADVDRFLPYVLLKQELTDDQFESLFIAYPKRVPEDFKSALVARIHQVLRKLRKHRLQGKPGAVEMLREIQFLEAAARGGFDGCRLIVDEIVGYRLELKPKR